jgi:hypothetical protein
MAALIPLPDPRNPNQGLLVGTSEIAFGQLQASRRCPGAA